MTKSQHFDPQIYIGTSGWSYPHWKQNFYPANVKQKLWLNFYSSMLSTVEINSTFYRMPLVSTVQNWVSQVPENFIFSIKASRYITHLKRLHDCQESLSYFYDVISHFKKKAGPILFQLPPSFKMNKDLLMEFTSFLHPDYDAVFEFRHESWFVDEIYELLSHRKIGLCITDLNGKLSPEEITSQFTYIRLHGPKEAYKGSYGKTKLKQWQKKIENWSQNISVYCYFDNDEKGYAIQDALSLKKFFKI